MASVSTTDIKLPKLVGANNLSESFGKINLSPEVKDFLASLGARLQVTYTSGSSAPDIEILDRTGNLVCSIDEFTKLGGYRRWVNDELKSLEKEQTSSERVSLIANFYRLATGNSIPLPDRIEEANETKFRQFHSMIKIIEDHMVNIRGTVDNDARKYLLDKAEKLVQILTKLMLDCMKAEKLPKEAIEEAIFERSIPKWLYNKLTDKQFTANLRNDAVVLMFPRGNYLKSMALTTKEMESEPFLTANAYALQKSGSIIKFAKESEKLKKILPPIPKQIEKDVESFISTYMWTLNSPYETSEILEIRAGGKSIPTFKARQKPNPRGGKARPETETQRVCREIHNTFGVLVSTWLNMQNLVIPSADPLAHFWSKILTGTDAWEITPTHGLYDHVKESGAQINMIKDLSNATLNKIMCEILCQAMQIPTQSDQGKLITSIVGQMEGKSDFEEFEPAAEPKNAKYAFSIESMQKIELEGTVLEETRKFLGIFSKPKKGKARRGGQSAVRLHTTVLNELEVVQNSKIYENVKRWISSTFKTGQFRKTQLLAARLVAGEVLKYQDELLDEDFDELKLLEDIEEYEDDE